MKSAINALLKKFKTRGRENPLFRPPGSSSTVLDQYIKAAPSQQNAADIFKGEWSSMLPEFAGVEAGTCALFSDQRISWSIDMLGSVEGKRVLELGPLEGGHTYMLESLGADSIDAIESNTRAYLKCLIVKEILQMKRAHFLLGDFVEYLRTTDEHYDICYASGVLYHMMDPAELISLIAKVASKVMVWTHYYDESIIKGRPELAHKFTVSEKTDYKGFQHTLYLQNYEAALNWSGFCGGGSTTSRWMSKEDILSCLNFFGFRNLDIGFDQPDHQNGPAFCVAASA